MVECVALQCIALQRRVIMHILTLCKQLDKNKQQSENLQAPRLKSQLLSSLQINRGLHDLRAIAIAIAEQPRAQPHLIELTALKSKRAAIVSIDTDSAL